MACSNPECLGNFNFNHVADFAIKRFVDGLSTIDLMQHARSELEKEEIALVSLLDVDDENMRELELCCKHAGKCSAINCREKLRLLVEKELVKRK
ncbi:MAG: hypothetical protein WBN96_07740 [Gammaproteobacteria bacterium]